MPTHHVLIADRDDSLATQYQEHLSQDGFEVRTAATATDCAELLRTYRPDVLVLDAGLLCGHDEILEVVGEAVALPLAGLIMTESGPPGETPDLWYVAHKVSLERPVPPARLADEVRSLLGIVVEKLPV